MVASPHFLTAFVCSIGHSGLGFGVLSRVYSWSLSESWFLGRPYSISQSESSVIVFLVVNDSITLCHSFMCILSIYTLIHSKTLTHSHPEMLFYDHMCYQFPGQCKRAFGVQSVYKLQAKRCSAFGCLHLDPE